MNPHALPFVMSVGFAVSTWGGWRLVGRFLPSPPEHKILDVLAENARLKQELNERLVVIPEYLYRPFKGHRKGMYAAEEWREVANAKSAYWLDWRDL